jgi:hypothetical protein
MVQKKKMKPHKEATQTEAEAATKQSVVVNANTATKRRRDGG